MVSVEVYYSPTCPKCEALLDRLDRLSAELGFEIEKIMVNTEFEPFYTKDPASKIYDEEWIGKFGTQKQKKLLEEAYPIIKMLGSTTHTPVLVVKWYDGIREKRIVIKGFIDDEELAKKAMVNLASLIKMLQNAELDVVGVRRSGFINYLKRKVGGGFR